MSLPVLPTKKTTQSGVLESKTVVLYGESGIGKSTLASEWAEGRMFFFDCAGELNDLEVFKSGEPPIIDWTSFRAWCASYAQAQTKETPQFAGCVIDTADVLGSYCAQAIRKRLGIVHESDAEWGKGWSLVREEFTTHINKLAALPGGLVIITHAQEVKIKKRRDEYSRMVPTLNKGIRETCVNMADLVLFIDWDDDGESRVICTKPDKHYEAKERGSAVRLPAEIPWPVGQSGYEVLRAAWYGASDDKTEEQ